MSLSTTLLLLLLSCLTILVYSSAFPYSLLSILSDQSLANALRRENIQLDRSLRALSLQHQRKLAGVCGAQLELRRALDKLNGPHRGVNGHIGSGMQSAFTHSFTSTPGTLLIRAPPITPKPCCPNHILCSICNLRLRLADSALRRFTPSLWTMYSRPLSESGPSQVSTYRMPSFVEHRNLSATDNSIRYLPFM